MKHGGTAYMSEKPVKSTCQRGPSAAVHKLSCQEDPAAFMQFIRALDLSCRSDRSFGHMVQLVKVSEQALDR